MTDPKDGFGEPLVDPKDAKVDIVFVHGLGGDRIGTWTWIGKDAEGEETVEFWPKDFLPEACSTARILSYGYNAHFAHFYPIYGPQDISAELTIDNHSTNLFQKLIGLREQTKTSDRPVIFVCHSLGGLVVANALSQNYREILDEKSTNLSLKTIGCLFLGTPFGGSDAAKYGSLALKVIKLVSRTQKDSMENLVRRSEKLKSINDAFAKLLKARDRSDAKSFIEVATFFEEYPFTKAVGLIVPRESAKLLGFDPVSIAANHVEMTKFQGRYVSGYVAVSGKLSQWIEGLNKTKTEREKLGLGNVNNVTMRDIQNYGGNVAGVVESNAALTGTNFNIGELKGSDLKDFFAKRNN